MAQRFAQISDPHLSSLAQVSPRDLLNKRLLGYLSWRRKRRFEHRPEVLEALLQDLQGQAYDQLLITGDLTHIGLPMEFQQSRDWLNALGSPTDIALVPGNHDSCVAAPWAETYALWQDYMASDPGADSIPSDPFPSQRRRGDIAFIGLSTACPTPPLMATGEVGAEQMQALPGLLDQAHDVGLFRVVYLHHSPIPGREKWRKRLRNAEAVAEIIAAHGAELVLHGHGHRARSEQLHSCHGTVPVMAVPSASAMGLHGADIAAYNQYEISRQDQGWTLQIQPRRFDPLEKVFEGASPYTFELRRPAPPPSPGNP